MTPFRVLSAVCLLMTVSPQDRASAQVVSETVDLSVVQKIKDEGMTRSKLDELALYLNDVIGARLTNSPASRKANAWAAETFRSWGLANVNVAPDGEYGWDGTAGTIFWIDPKEQTVIMLMTQSVPANPDSLRQRFKALVRAAIRTMP